jgi:hypothetical protein
MVFQTLLKMIIELRNHQTTESYEQAMGIHVLKREGAKNLLDKNYFANVCS